MALNLSNRKISGDKKPSSNSQQGEGIMSTLTETANSKSWFEENRLCFCLENLMSTISVSERPAEQNDLIEILDQVSVRVLKDGFHIEPALDAEFRCWDSLSDEALMSFEQKLS